MPGAAGSIFSATSMTATRDATRGVSTAAGSPLEVDTGSAEVDVSVVMPCLNEAGTVGRCVERAYRALERAGWRGEIIVADNGSTDDSRGAAESSGARVVRVEALGYGSALMGGIAMARGRYVVMGDADGSYDFDEAPALLAKLDEGFDLVQGCRLPAGGGTVRPGAMRSLHRWWGNPMFSWLARRWFGASISDIHSGMRAFRTAWYRQLGLCCTGMEFALEMVIRAALSGARVAEVPITLHPDGRQGRRSHLRTFRDGWRHLRFYLIYSPRWLFLAPGVLLTLLGLAGYAVAMPKMRIAGVTLDVHTLLFASLAIICGYQSVLFAVFTKVFAIGEGLLPLDRRMERAFAHVTLEKGLMLGVLAMMGGLVLLGGAVVQWRARRFGDLDYEHTMRWVIPGVMLTALGFQTLLSSFFLSILGLRRR